jgi:hypothetical protein
VIRQLVGFQHQASVLVHALESEQRDAAPLMLERAATAIPDAAIDEVVAAMLAL